MTQILRSFFLLILMTSSAMAAVELKIPVKQQRLLFKTLANVIIENRTFLLELAAKYGLSMSDFQKEIKMVTLAEKIKILIEGNDAISDVFPVDGAVKMPAKLVLLSPAEELEILKKLRLWREQNEKKLSEIVRPHKLTMVEFRDALTESDTRQLFDTILDFIESGQDGPKLARNPPILPTLENFIFRIKMDELDDLYYRIKPFESRFFEELERLDDMFGSYDEATFKKLGSEYPKRKSKMLDDLKSNISRHCEAFARIEPYLQRRGMMCGSKCTPIEVCKMVGF